MLRIFVTLLLGCMAGLAALVPYAIDLMRLHPAMAQQVGELPTAVFAPVIMLQGMFVSALLIGCGLYLMRSLDLGLPLIERLAGGPHVPARSVLLPGLEAGAIVGLFVLAVDMTLFASSQPEALRQVAALPVTERLLAGLLYGGINEEVMLRLFLMPLLINLVGILWRRANGMPADGAYWIGIVGAALVFAAGHLPMLASLAPLDTVLLARTLLLNGVPGVVFGWLFWRHGFEAAVAGHMASHLVIIPGAMLFA